MKINIYIYIFNIFYKYYRKYYKMCLYHIDNKIRISGPLSLKCKISWQLTFAFSIPRYLLPIAQFDFCSVWRISLTVNKAPIK